MSQIDLPTDALELAEEQAAAAGFPDVNEYLLTLIRLDQEQRQQLHSLGSDKRLERLAMEGLESGDAGPMTKANWAELRAELSRRIEKRRT